METEDLKRSYKEAAEIAKVVPEAMQEAAFNRALDSLLGSKIPPAKGRERQSRPRRQDGQTATVADTKARVANVLESVNRTKYPHVSPGKNVLPNALWILRAAKDDCGFDGLTA